MERTKSPRRPMSNRMSISSSMQSSSQQLSPRYHSRRSMDYDDSIFTVVSHSVHSPVEMSPRSSSLSQSANQTDFEYFPRTSFHSNRNTYGSTHEFHPVAMEEFRERQFSPISVSPINKQPLWMTAHALPSKTLADGVRVVTLDDVETLHQLGTKEIKFVDCRYPYEYEVGKMENAINVYNSHLLQQHFPIDTNIPQDNRVIIFYCEFSGDRAPKLLKELMKNDRMSMNSYYVYGDVYLLEGGFAAAFKAGSSLCGGCYREMKDRNFAHLMHTYSKEATSNVHNHSRSSSVSPVRSPIYTQTIFSSQSMQ